MNISTYEIYIGLAINGIFTGLGVALGTWFANKHIIKTVEKKYKKIKKFIKKKY